MAHRYLNPSSLPNLPGFTQVVEARGGRTVYVSGQVALDAAGAVVGEGNLGAQAEQIFGNLQAALTAVGATFEDVVKLTFFATDLAQFAAVREVRDRYVSREHPPASTAVEVRRLVREELLLEVEAIAVLPA